MINLIAILIGLLFGNAVEAVETNWAKAATIVGIGPWDSSSAQAMVDWAANSGASVVCIDVEINNTYANFQNPEGAIRFASYVDSIAKLRGLHTFAYLSGLEIITNNADMDRDGRPDSGIHTVYTDHPDWLQMKYNQSDTAVFYGAWAFWLDPTDESAWVSPWNPEWKTYYLSIIDEIAKTNIDAIYVDVPYFMTMYEGWWDSWASFDPNTISAYQAGGGTVPNKSNLGNFDDIDFRNWMHFRYYTINTMLGQIRGHSNVKPVIIEEYPCAGPDAVYTGCDAYRIIDYVDFTTHEYEPKIWANKRGVYEWLMFSAGLLLLRAIDGDKPTWILSYVNGDEEGNLYGDVANAPGMNNLANILVQTGCNYWETGGWSMNNTAAYLEHRTQIFHWISVNGDIFYNEREPVNAVGVYFSPYSRDYSDWGGWGAHLAGFMGLIMALMELHYEVQVVTPKTIGSLDASEVPVLFLANTACMSDEEAGAIVNYVQDKGGFLIIVDDPEWDSSGTRNETGSIRTSNAFDNLVGYTNFKCYGVSPGKVYFNATSYDAEDEPTFVSYPNFTAEEAKSQIDSLLKHEVDFYPYISTNAPASVIVQSRIVNDRLYIYVTNFTGITYAGNQTPTIQTNLTFTVASHMAFNVQCLPYLGNLRSLNTEFDGSKVTIYLDTLIVGATIITDYEVGKSEKALNDMSDYKLMQNYPNPFTSLTTISYQIGNTKCKMLNAKHSLKIYDISGRLVRTLVDRPITNYQSTHPYGQTITIYWDGKDDLGDKVSSGAYFYQLKIGDKSSYTKKLTYLRENESKLQ
ncbi:MAG TPA: T9SS type A sorting domain-containing protein [bacterium (Candidatus Stahlbacteria)]|nr:T9SS type A sorting domain-containing protein [Candidatus Stahlbacteria bacterium]